MSGKHGSISAARACWEQETLEPTLRRHPEGRERFITTSSEPVERLYTPEDLPDFDYLRDLGFPGEYPFTRGIHATGYRGRLWTMRMFAGSRRACEKDVVYDKPRHSV